MVALTPPLILQTCSLFLFQTAILFLLNGTVFHFLKDQKHYLLVKLFL